MVVTVIVPAAKAGWATGAATSTMAAIVGAFQGAITSGEVGTLLGCVIVGGVAGAGATHFKNEAVEDFKGEFDIPTIVYTPFAIFSGLVPLFDVNFFNPNTGSVQVLNVADCISGGNKIQAIEDKAKDPRKELEESMNVEVDPSQYGGKYQELIIDMSYIASWSCYVVAASNNDSLEDLTMPEQQQCLNIVTNWLENGVLCFNFDPNSNQDLKNASSLPVVIEGVINKDVASVGLNEINKQVLSEIPDVNNFDYKCLSFEKIFRTVGGGETDLLGHLGFYKDFYNLKIKSGLNLNDYESTSALIDKEYPGGVTQLKKELLELFETTVILQQQLIKNGLNSKTFEDTRIASVLQKTVSSWYYNLRNLALVILLVILVYIGIRIVLSSTAPEKAKYKQMITNWVVAICILFLLHIIMITILTISEKIVEGLKSSCVESVVINLPKDTRLIKEDGTYNKEPVGDNPFVNTNFVGYVRYLAGIYCDKKADSSALYGVGYVVMYIMLVVQTCMFTWVYGKRVVYMAFLTIIAPLVAITYPIDKIGDGKSQAFDMWIKEYIFNALLQPIHLLIYTLLCGTALDLMMKQPIYGIIALAFVVPAEKFIRKMFGFEKAQTPSALGGAAGAALAMTGVQRLGGLIRPDGRDDREADKPPKSHRIRQVDTSTQSNERSATDAARERYLENGSRDIRTNGGSSNQRENNNQAKNGENPTPIGSGDDNNNPPNNGGTPPSIEEDSNSPDDDGNPPVTPLGEVDNSIDDGETPTTIGEVDNPINDGENTPTDGEIPTPIGGVDSSIDDGENPEPIKEANNSPDDDEILQVTPLGEDNDSLDDEETLSTAEENPTPDVGDNSTQTNGISMDEMARRQAARDQARMEERSQRQAADVQRQVQEETKARAELNRQRPLNRARRARDQFMDMQRRRIENANTPKKWARRRRKLRRAVVGGTFGAGTALTMAAIKMATGASGSDVTNTAIAGGVAGYAIGNKGTQKVQEFEKMDDVRDALDKGWYTAEERKQRLSAEAIKEWKNNRDNMEVFTEAFGENAKERMNSQFTDMCLTHGVQEAESIAAAHDYMQSAEFQETYSGESEETQQLLAIEAAKDIATYGDIRHDQKKLDEMRARKKNQFLENEMVQAAAAEEHRRLEEAHDQESIRIRNEESNLNTTMQNDQELIDSNREIQEANAEVEKLNSEIVSKSKEVEEAIRKANNSYDADEALYAQELRVLEEQEAEIEKEEQAIRSEESGFAELEKYNGVGGVAEATVIAIQSDIDNERTAYNQAVITNNIEMQERATQRIKELETQRRVAEEELARGRFQIQQERAKLNGKRKELEDRKSSIASKKQTLNNSKTEKIRKHNARKEETARMEKEIAEMRKKAEEERQEVQTRKKKDEALRKRKYGEQIEQLNKAKEENEKPIKTEEELREEYAYKMAVQSMRQFNNILGHRDNYVG